MFRFATDVAIVGGGPAGAAAALTLRRYTGVDCVLIEASDYSAQRIGETVSPALLPLLDYIGAARSLPSAAKLPSYGTEAAWGQADPAASASIFSGGGGWTLDRRRFDVGLADAATRVGATLLRSAVLRAVEPGPGEGWTLVFQRNGSYGRLHARQVIDASGRRAAFARRIGATATVGHKLIAISAYYLRGAEARIPQTLLVEATRDGWWYATCLPGGRVVAAYLTDADRVRLGIGSAERLFETAFMATSHIACRLSGTERVGRPRGHAAEPRQLQPCIGPAWVAAGDAARSFDPLSSLGIGHALSSGIQAARIAYARLGGDETLSRSYAWDVARIGAEHDKRQRLLYAAERRWLESDFWRRRAPHAAAMAESA